MLSVALILVAALVCPQARAEEATTLAAQRESLKQAIEHEKERRRGAITGMVVGGAIVLAGSIASAITSSANRVDRDNGRSANRNSYVGYAVGLGLGLPIAGISAYIFSDSQHKLNRLRQQQVSLVYSPEAHAPMLQLAFGF